MVIKRNNDGRYDFREKMVIKNRIMGMARISVKHLNGESCYVYDLGSFQTLNKVFDGKPMGMWELRALFSGISAAARETERYLLDFRDILMDPALLLWDTAKGEPGFCYYPGNPEGEKGYEALGQFLIDTVDKDDEQASKAAYDYYDRLCDGILLPDGILTMYDETGEGQETGFKPVSLRKERGDIREEYEQEPERESGSQEGRGSYYSEDTQEIKEEHEGVNPLLLLLFFIPAVVSSAVYGFVYLSPSRLRALGITDSGYIRTGIAVAVLSGLLTTALVYLWNRRREDSGGEEDPDSQLA